MTLVKPQRTAERISFSSVANAACHVRIFWTSNSALSRSSFNLKRILKTVNPKAYLRFSVRISHHGYTKSIRARIPRLFRRSPALFINECIERGLTYSVPLKAKLKLYCTDPEHEDFETIVQDVYLGTIPYMTPQGSFVVNGAERVIVNQLHRSPGVFFGQSRHANGTKLYSARIIPFKGSWIEFATDINSVMYAYIDRKKEAYL